MQTQWLVWGYYLYAYGQSTTWLTLTFVCVYLCLCVISCYSAQGKYQEATAAAQE
jgi:hypothetical protein